MNQYTIDRIAKNEMKIFFDRVESESTFKGTPFCETFCDICNKKILVGGEMHVFMYPIKFNVKKLCKNCLVIETTRICPEKLEGIINPKSN